MRQFWDDRVPKQQRLTDPQKVLLSQVGDVEGLRVLELGCGTGEISAVLDRLGANVTAVDFSSHMVDAAIARHPDSRISFINADVLHLDLRDRFDLILGTMFLHEIAQDDFVALVDVLDRHVAPKGRILFIENSFFNPLFRFLRLRMVDKGVLRKVGSRNETPFDASRFSLLKARFPTAQRRVDEFQLFGRAFNQFLSHFRFMGWTGRLGTAIDRMIDRFAPARIKLAWSYSQTIEATKL
ncbi:MAG: class I SAM-dependent methyltransferase [Actinomycetota bacterium]|nr:class I SAM-dependent methyltransferase [Actinomycetota bacterium]